MWEGVLALVISLLLVHAMRILHLFFVSFLKCDCLPRISVALGEFDCVFV